MSKGILGKKVGMTQIFTDNGELIPVTVIEATQTQFFKLNLSKQTVTKQLKLVSIHFVKF